jgi:hypothetical protein
MVSFPQSSPPTPCARLYPPPYAPHALPISFVSILPPAQYWVKSTTSPAEYMCASVVRRPWFTRAVALRKEKERKISPILTMFMLQRPWKIRPVNETKPKTAWMQSFLSWRWGQQVHVYRTTQIYIVNSWSLIRNPARTSNLVSWTFKSSARYLSSMYLEEKYFRNT